MLRRIVLALLAASFATAPLGAQVCTTLNDCIRATLVQRVRSQVSEALSELVAGQNPGESTELPGAASTINDFLSRLRMSADSGGLGNGDGDGEALVFELNDFLGLPVNDGYKFQALLGQPEVFAPLAEAIPEDVRATRVSELEKGLNDFDNVTFVFTYSPMGRSMGRKPSLYLEEREALLAAVMGGMQMRSLTNDVFKSQFDLGAIIQDLPDEAQQAIADQNLQDPGSLDLSALEPDTATAVREALEKSISALDVRTEALLEALTAAGYFSLTDLISNQPQLYVNAQRTSPNELIGPRKVTGKLTYEHGFVNINRLRRTCRLKAAEDDATADQEKKRLQGFLSCFQGFLTPERIAQMQRGDRLALSVEYSDVEDYKVTLPGDTTTTDDDVTLDLPADRKLVASLALGRYLTFFKDGAGSSRIEAESKYEDYGEDPQRQERWVTTLTFSQKLADQAVFTLGLVYADRPEFRGVVDKEISARVGLSYRLLRKGEI
jgi:hypothetical protein